MKEEKVTISKEQAIEQLRLWPRWVEPADSRVRLALLQIGACGPRDTVLTSTTITHRVAEHEKPYLFLLRRVARIAGAKVQIFTFIGRAGNGKYEKRYARVVIKEDSKFSDDDFFVRLDCENRNVRYMFAGGEDRLGKVRS